jgi:large subunit ribosomal protein L10
MSKYVKELMMDQLKSDLDGNRSLLIVDLKDLDAIAEHNFRRHLRKKAIRLRVLKNSLARRVFSDMGMDGLSKYLEGQSAVVWGGEGPSELAKEITAQFKTLKKPQIKGGAVDGVVVGPEQVEDITRLPSREVLIGQVLSLLLGPARQTLSLLSSSASTVVGQLEALAKRGGEAGDEAPAAEPGNEAPAAEPGNEAPAVEPGNEAPAADPSAP